MIYLILVIPFFLIIKLYFIIADKYNIIDHPNERSSHSKITIRGGGIIFVFAALVAMAWDFKFFYLAGFGLITIGTISFLDDIYTLSNKIRLIFHVIAVSLIFSYLNIYALYPVLGIIALYIFAIGVINAYNFMDGINGITGLYSLVVLAGLQYVNLKQTAFVSADVIWLPMLACVTFLFFNFRKKAKCFAGDVGSITIALWIVMLILKGAITTGNYIYILFLAVYGIDTVVTILYRLLLKQNIFQAHRMHFYQLLANECKISHLKITLLYSFIQVVIIIFVIINNKFPPVVLFTLVIISLVLIYFIARYSVVRKLKKAVLSQGAE
jgi:UDP-N-acetylmuramyl pentapeptide phosphotransferase/UDP-N-acetylglucosamine-1-phosphate transferase